MNAENDFTTLTATTRCSAPEMKSESARLTADANETLAEFAEEINRVIDPPQALSADDILVRSLLLVSDAPNLYGGKFGKAELRRIAELALDSPVLVGHRKDTLPIARVFRAEVLTHEDELWVRAHFYWLKKASGSETLGTNIDGGLYKECSLGFTFLRAECSVCGSDVRGCAHNPECSSGANDADYFYRDIQRVLEISLVYRGATPHTKVGSTLGFSEMALAADKTDGEATDFVPALMLERIRLLTDTRKFSPEQLISDYHAESQDVLPTVLANTDTLEDLPLLIGRSGGEMFALCDDGRPAPDKLASVALQLTQYPERDFLFYGRLLGMRGKQRRSLSELARRLTSNAGPVRSFKLRALALLYWDSDWANGENAAKFRNQLEEICKGSDRLSLARRLNTTSLRNQGGYEQILTNGSGTFQFLRAPAIPGTLCRRIEIGASLESLSVNCCQSDCADLESADSAAAVAIVKFDRVIHSANRLRLVNSRIGAQLGNLCGEETYLFHSPPQGCDVVIGRNTIINLRELSEQPFAVRTFSAGGLSPGMCQALELQTKDKIESDCAVSLSLGSAATLQITDADRSFVRVIELQSGDRRIAALLAEERNADVAS